MSYELVACRLRKHIRKPGNTGKVTQMPAISNLFMSCATAISNVRTMRILGGGKGKCAFNATNMIHPRNKHPPQLSNHTLSFQLKTLSQCGDTTNTCLYGDENGLVWILVF